MRLFILLLAASALGLSSGCAGFGLPGWYESRDVGQQRVSAQRFDPYPQNDTGPPVVGGRPHDYQDPVAEPSRARWNPNTWLDRFQY